MTSGRSGASRRAHVFKSASTPLRDRHYLDLRSRPIPVVPSDSETVDEQVRGVAGASTLEHASILFVGTATTVIRYGGFTILTDPNFLHAGDHVHLGYGLKSTRLTDPAVEIEELPPLDLCVLSHLHGDHWDRVADAKLPKALPIVTTHHAAERLQARGFAQARGLSTWESAIAVRDEIELRITAMPARHGPPLVHRALPPTMGSLLEWTLAERSTGREESPRFRLYISGDTLVFDELYQIRKRHPGIDLALIHLGGTEVLRVMVTMDAEQGVRALRILRPKIAVPIHYDDYGVFKSPIQDFLEAAKRARLETEVHFLGRGDTLELDIPAPLGAPRRSSSGLEPAGEGSF